MILPDTSGWTHVCETPNSALYVVEPRILAIVPRRGVVDDGETARANLDAVNRYFEEAGPGCVIVFYDPMISQDADARRLYTVPNPLVRGAALVGGNLLSRAMMSFFLGMRRATAVTKICGDVPSAIAFARSIVEPSGAK